MDRYTLIESYLMNAMSEEDKAAFERRMTEEPALKLDVKAHAKMKVGLNALSEADMRNVLDSERGVGGQRPIVKRNLIPRNIRTMNRRRMWSVAASLLLLVAAGWWWTNQDTIKTLGKNDVLYAELFRPSVEDKTRGEEGVQPTNNEASFNSGMDFMKAEKHNEAISVLENIKGIKDKTLQDKVDWYLALNYLKLDKKEKLESMLRKIINDPKHAYYELGVELGERFD